MKSMSFIVALLFFVPPIFSADSTQEALMKSDSMISKLVKGLPGNWEARFEDGTIVIERLAEVMVLLENKINAPINRESPEERKKRFELYGKKSKMALVFRLEPRWGEEKIEEAMKTNEKLQEEIFEFSKKLGLEKFTMISPNRKGVGRASTPNPDEERKLEEFRRFREEKEKKFIVFPAFHSEKFSWFHDREIASENEFQSIYPSSASEELYGIKQIIDQTLERGEE